MSIYQIWVPGSRGYKEHLDRKQFSDDNLSAIRTQTNEFKKSINEQSANYSSQTKTIIASNEQIISSLNDGFNRLSQINERGFARVTSAIEDLNSDMNYFLGVLCFIGGELLLFSNSVMY